MAAGEVKDAWGQEVNVFEYRKFRFEQMFEAALRIKAYTTITDQTFEFIVHPPGTNSEDVPENGPEIADDDEEQCWILGTLQSRRQNLTSNPRDSLIDALVGANCFVEKRPGISDDKILHRRAVKIPKTEAQEFQETSSAASTGPVADEAIRKTFENKYLDSDSRLNKATTSPVQRVGGLVNPLPSDIKCGRCGRPFQTQVHLARHEANSE